jgi:hypothetical protein
LPALDGTKKDRAVTKTLLASSSTHFSEPLPR